MKTWLRLLTFRFTCEDYTKLGRQDLVAGLVVCWLVGIGRYWDDTRATALQHSGIGSVIYIFVLAALMWLVAKPVAPESFRYESILTFISLTSPPAAVYAIPVERWMNLEAANMTNLRFLGVVALWRLALWMHFLLRLGRLRVWPAICVATVPLALIFITLTSLNLHHVVFNIMGGIRDADRTSQDAAYGVLFVLSYLSVPISLIACCCWIWIISKRYLRGETYHR